MMVKLDWFALLVVLTIAGALALVLARYEGVI